jgi:putative ABC transport system permease protein
LFVRSVSTTASLASAIRKEVASIDKDQPVTSIKDMGEVISATTAPRKFNSVLLGVFAALALLFATLGIYSVISYSVVLRTQEIGIRVALGARRSAISTLVIRRGMTLALIGAAIGLAGAFAVTRLMSSLLFGISSADPLTFAAVSLVLLATALLACLIPARRATRVDPLAALRNE